MLLLQVVSLVAIVELTLSMLIGLVLVAAAVDGASCLECRLILPVFLLELSS
jgi:hypothetical protein